MRSFSSVDISEEGFMTINLSVDDLEHYYLIIHHVQFPLAKEMSRSFRFPVFIDVDTCLGISETEDRYKVLDRATKFVDRCYGDTNITTLGPMFNRNWVTFVDVWPSHYWWIKFDKTVSELVGSYKIHPRRSYILDADGSWWTTGKDHSIVLIGETDDDLTGEFVAQIIDDCILVLSPLNKQKDRSMIFVEESVIKEFGIDSYTSFLSLLDSVLPLEPKSRSFIVTNDSSAMCVEEFLVKGEVSARKRIKPLKISLFFINFLEFALGVTCIVILYYIISKRVFNVVRPHVIFDRAFWILVAVITFVVFVFVLGGMIELKEKVKASIDSRNKTLHKDAMKIAQQLIIKRRFD